MMQFYLRYISDCVSLKSNNQSQMIACSDIVFNSDRYIKEAYYFPMEYTKTILFIDWYRSFHAEENIQNG